VEQVERGIASGGEMENKECPNCHSKRIWKDGMRETSFGYVQRYLCLECRFRFSQKSNIELATSTYCQLCAIPEGKAKKLDTTQEIKTCAGLDKATELTIRGEIAQFPLYCKRKECDRVQLRLSTKS
jgi:hypothetical protein